MARELSDAEREQFFLDLNIIRRLHDKQKEAEQIADMLEWNIEDVELVINLIEDGFYDTNNELLKAFLSLQ